MDLNQNAVELINQCNDCLNTINETKNINGIDKYLSSLEQIEETITNSIEYLSNVIKKN